TTSQPRGTTSRDATTPQDGTSSLPAPQPASTPEDIETTAASALLDTQPEQPTLPKTPISVGQVRLECPQCGNHGFFDLNKLNKLIRCRNCHSVCRVDALGGLVKVATVDPGVEVEVQSDTGGWSKHRVPIGTRPKPAGKAGNPDAPAGSSPSVPGKASKAS